MTIGCAVLTSLLVVLLFAPPPSRAAEREDDYYRLVTLPIPRDLKLEVSGLAVLPDGRVAAAIRKGEVWLIDGAHGDPTKMTYTRYASGLHEPLGLAHRDGALYTVQRTELTRLRDRDRDGVADEYRTVARGWGVTGNYHEYAYGPKFDRDGHMWVTLNCTIGKTAGPGFADDRWRGWTLRVGPDGSWSPVSAGCRSPVGIGVNRAGDAFFTDHQGNWVPTCALHHIQRGVFHGHTAALKHAKLTRSPLKPPSKVPSGLPYPEAIKRIKGLRPPAVWFPYRKMGMGSTDVVPDTTGGRFGPFADQFFVGDFTLSMITRVDLERVNGEYQGACFPFRKGFQSAVLRMAFGTGDTGGKMFVGMTNRGWNSVGSSSFGLQRLEWTGKTPFEIRRMLARPDGFELIFTQPVEPKSAGDAASYNMSSYTYRYQSRYGSDEIDTKKLTIRQAIVSPDHLSLRLKVDGLRAGYVHELHAPAVRSADGRLLLHDAAYYTLNQIPTQALPES